MTDENRKLAEWMGWKLGFAPNHSCPSVQIETWFEDDEPIIAAQSWHPRTSITQAMMLLEKARSWVLRKDKTGFHQADVNFDGKVFESTWQMRPEAAIVEAVLRVIEESQP